MRRLPTRSPRLWRCSCRSWGPSWRRRCRSHRESHPADDPIVDEADVVGLQTGEPSPSRWPAQAHARRSWVIPWPWSPPSDSRRRRLASLERCDTGSRRRALRRSRPVPRCRAPQREQRDRMARVRGRRVGEPAPPLPAPAGACRLSAARFCAQGPRPRRLASLRRARGCPGTNPRRVRCRFAVDTGAASSPDRDRSSSRRCRSPRLCQRPTSSSRPERASAEAAGRPVHVMASEAEAAALGALTTPGAPGGRGRVRHGRRRPSISCGETSASLPRAPESC